jgi:hypothetical protein
VEVLVVLWTTMAAAAAPCDRAEVAKVLEALPQVSEEQQATLAAVGLSEACPRAGAFAEAAGRLAAVMPEQRALVDARLALDDPAAWIAACPGGPSALAAAMTLAPAERAASLWKSCALAERGWFEAAEWGRLRGWVVVPLVAAKPLTDSGVSAAEVRTLVRALAGLPHPQTKPPEPMIPFLEALPTIPEPPVEDF